MTDDFDQSGRDRDEVYSKSVKAGKRTYFFDVKSTRGNDLYITITESKRKQGADGNSAGYEKHKIFLYKEDFEKFIDGLQDAVEKINELKVSGAYPETEQYNRSNGKFNNDSYSDVDFEKL
jgi:hypothetical protein